MSNIITCQCTNDELTKSGRVKIVMKREDSRTEEFKDNQTKFKVPREGQCHIFGMVLAFTLTAI